MAIRMIVVGFDGDPPMDVDDILGYAGFDPVASGKNLWGPINRWIVNTKVKGASIFVVKILEETMESDCVSMVFVNAIPPDREKDELFVARRLAQVRDVVTEFCNTVDFGPENTIESFAVDNMSAMVMSGLAAKLDEFLISDIRQLLTVVNNPPKE